MVTITDISRTGAVISWNIPSFIEQEEYVVEYGLSASALDLVSDTIQSITDTSINFEPYNVTLQGLADGTQYYFRVVARFGVGGVYVRSTNLFSFFTHFERKYSISKLLVYVCYNYTWSLFQRKLITFHS